MQLVQDVDKTAHFIMGFEKIYKTTLWAKHYFKKIIRPRKILLFIAAILDRNIFKIFINFTS